MPQNTVIIALIAAAVFFTLGYLVRKFMAESKIGAAEVKAQLILEEASREAENKKREALVGAKEEVLRLRNEVEREHRERRSELQRLERRLLQKEETLDRKLEGVEKKEENLSRKEAELGALKEELNRVLQQEVQELERISGLSKEEAKTILLRDVEKEMQQEIAVLIKELENKARDEADRKPRRSFPWLFRGVPPTTWPSQRWPSFPCPMMK